MALPTASPPHRSPQVVGAAFVNQYYNVLHHSPELVYRFYQECSILSRPDSSGKMIEVTTLQAINEKVLSFKFNSYTALLETVDSSASYNDGVLIVVTGWLSGSDNARKNFVQSFFLAPQENGGFFVLNDIFRFVEASQPEESSHVLDDDDIVDAPEAPLTAAPEPSLVQENHVEDDATPPLEEDLANHEEVVVHTLENGESKVEEEPAVVSPVPQGEPNGKLDHVAAPSVEDKGPKKSYASIVKVVGNKTPPKKFSVPAVKAKAKEKAAPSTVKPLNASTKPATTSEPKVPSSNNSPDDTSLDEGYSVYVRNLPYNSTVENVEEELKKFGPIKPGGVQVRNHKVDNFCYGFAEFEHLTSMQAAIQASPITMGDHRVHIEEKRTTTRVVNGVVITSSNNGRGRFNPGRGGFRNDNFRGNDNFHRNYNFRGNDNFHRNYNFRGNDNSHINGNFRGNDNSHGNGNFRGNNFRGNDEFRGDRNNHQGYGRMEFRNRGNEFSGRGRGPPGHFREGAYQQRPIQNGNSNGRVVRPAVVKETTIAA